MTNKPLKTKRCLNCGEKILGEYCYQCGQKNTVRQISIWLLISDILDDYITLDSKLGKSLFLLFFKPGTLTKEYNAGRHVKYIRPLRLYLTASLLYFFLFSFTLSMYGTKLQKIEIEEIPISELNKPISGETAADSIQSEVAGETAADSLPSERPNEGTADSLPSKNPDPGTSILILGMEPHEIDSIIEHMRVTLDDTSTTYFESKINTFLITQWERVRAQTMKELMSSILSDLERNLPKIMFFLLPIFALILKVIYLRTRKFYVEHLIFSLHFHTFLFFIMSLVILIKIDMIGLIAFVIILVYLFLSMKTTHAQSNVLTMAKFTLLLGSYIAVLVLSFATAILFALLLA